MKKLSILLAAIFTIGLHSITPDQQETINQYLLAQAQKNQTSVIESLILIPNSLGGHNLIALGAAIMAAPTIGLFGLILQSHIGEPDGKDSTPSLLFCVAANAITIPIGAAIIYAGLSLQISTPH